MIEPTPTRPRRWLPFLPFVLVVVIAVAWSAAWVFAARRADAIITAWIEQEARSGRVYSCGSRTSGGYPFRIEVRCTDPAVELASLSPPRTLRAKELVGVAQVYQPNLIIAEITGPLAIVEADAPALWRADWRLAQASLRGRARNPERLSIVLDELKLERAEGSPGETLGTANHLELHLRRNPASAADKPVIEFAFDVAGATVPSAAMLAGPPFDGEITALVSGLSDLQAKPVSARLREWQGAGGRLEVTKLRIRQGEAIALAAGEIGLSAAGRPDGAFNITMAGFDRLAQDLAKRGGQANGLQLGVVAGLSFLGRPAEIDGKRAVSVPLRFKDGAVSLGPIPLGKIPPLY